MPNMSDAARKRTLADFVVKTKKQVVKLYVAVKWARDAGAVQKAMNVTAFLGDQNRQFEDAINGLKNAKDSLDPARLRNHDLLTSLDVLTTGAYRRLPSGITKAIIPPTPLSDGQVGTILSDMEDVIRYRLRMHEVIPPEMANYRIADGRVHFTVPKLFEASLCLRGAHRDDGWFFVNAEFLFTRGGDSTGMQDFPRIPTGILKTHITEEADARLAFYLPLPQNPALPPSEMPPRPQLPEGVVDAPLVRVYNFLQMMSMSYQLEILWYQAERLRSLGWAEFLKVDMSNDRKTLVISYWIRKPPPQIPGRPPQRSKLPPLGGSLTIAITPTTQPSPPPPPPSRTRGPSSSQHHNQSQNQQVPSGSRPPPRKPKARVLMELQERAKLGTKGRPSDEVEGVQFAVRWEPINGALGVGLSRDDVRVADGELAIDADDLDVEALLRKVIRKHTRAILGNFQLQLQRGPYRNVFGPPGEVVLVDDEETLALQVRLCADEIVIVTVDPRTGRLTLHDTGDIAAAGRGPHFRKYIDLINENPPALAQWLTQLRFATIVDIAEQKANYLGLRNFRTRNFSADEMKKLGPVVRGTLYIQLANFPKNYLVLVVGDDDFRYALITVELLAGTMYTELAMKDVAWVMVDRMHGEIDVTPVAGPEEGMAMALGRKRPGQDANADASQELHQSTRFNLETQVLRELYSYCCARVAYLTVEQQLKTRGLKFQHLDPLVSRSPELAHLHSSLARSIPALCVQSADILAGAPAAEAAMPNIRVIPLNWWCNKKAQVVTCVKLKYVQQPVGKRAGGAIIRPSKRIIYDTREAVVSFLSEDVGKCVDEFLEEWAKVSKMVVIAREIAQMATEKQWNDVRLLSFDLQTVEFAYSGDYAVSITCTDQLSLTGGSYELHFSRATEESASDPTDEQDIDKILAQYNPHEDIEPFVRNLLRRGPLAESLHRLVALLRNTLPIVAELEYIRVSSSKTNDAVETYPKTAGWFRVLFGDLRHALDFRLMSDARVVILDASNSLYPSLPHSTSTTSSLDSSLVLQPIPNFRTLVATTCRELTGNFGGSKVTPVDVGVICHSSAVRAVGRSLYERVHRALKEMTMSVS